MNDPHSPPSSHSHAPHQPDHEHRHPGITWFLRRELVSVPLAVVLVLVLLVFGISPATLLFIALLTALTLGWIWSGNAPMP